AFAVRGMRLDLEGEANDYVGKGLSGGEICIRPFRQIGYGAATHGNTLVGNTCLYGATGGRLFVAGQAGSRFAVRNSGALAVIEGAGNHCCEYMTGGTVLILGSVGRNFAAGMSHGVAFVLDESGQVPGRLNRAMVDLEPVTTEDLELILGLIHEHQERTGSARARQIILSWPEYSPLFRKVTPHAARSLLPVGAATEPNGSRQAEATREALPPAPR
ncbi:MAG: glutamate synthase subunit alpha, partial [Gemmatimonadota bacterium]|nr:glutamate synthase subunit alpha [Gemmatimonadota bacterium]